MDINEPLQESEAALLTVLLGLPYKKRIGYALRLVNAHRNDPALLSLIHELLSTTLLPDQVPLAGTEQDDGYITLLFPQTTASKRFFQRELGLAMASALAPPAIPLLLDAIIHPSTAGKSRAITACVSPSSEATDRQLATGRDLSEQRPCNTGEFTHRHGSCWSNRCFESPAALEGASSRELK
jgi:hypothetical protein